MLSSFRIVFMLLQQQPTAL